MEVEFEVALVCGVTDGGAEEQWFSLFVEEVGDVRVEDVVVDDVAWGYESFAGELVVDDYGVE